MADSDEPIVPAADVVENSGAKVFLWPGGMSTEERIAADLPSAGVASLIGLGIRHSSIDAVRAQIKNAGAGEEERFRGCVEHLTSEVLPNAFTEDERLLVGRAAKAGRWFKTVEGGEKLAGLLSAHLPSMEGTPTAEGIEALRHWLDEKRP